MTIRKTPLYAAHAEAGARFVDFHGWEMPVQYEGILDETRRVRNHGGLFDLCHMGRLVISGPDREALVERVFSGNLAKLRHGRAKYGFLLNADGYPIDDVLVYRDHEVIHIVINATGRDGDGPWVQQQCEAAGFNATVEDVSESQAMIALQGRASEHVLQPLCGTDLSAVRYYGFANAPVCGHPALLARTGYTGEDGFELFFDPQHAPAVWDALLESGAALEVRPIGLGARDLLRLEAGMPLYGQEITTEIDPLEADLAFGVDLTKDATVGVSALRARQAAGVARTAISLAQVGGRVPRTGCPVLRDGQRVGIVTSGGVSPTVGKNIARALVTREAAAQGGTFDVEIRGHTSPMSVVPHPFYKRAR
ncbi:MAG: glycine cleavage system aminomethyltransferase GcvT [Planctomycetota bacterium]|nr:glycine cleavage system aminomethyltransferase GcvT [Planctomycetota bacterium]